MENRYKKAFNELLRFYLGDEGNKLTEYRYEKEIYEWMEYHRLQYLYADYVLSSCSNIQAQDRQFLTECRNKSINRANTQLEILNEVITEIEKNEIRYVLLKGNAVANSYYHVPWHRQFDDIDILIDYCDSQKAVEALTKIGYVQGWYWEGRIRHATREEILHQRMFTHELFNMVKMYGEYESNVDINHKFGWLGIDGQKYKRLKFPYLYGMSKKIEIGSKLYTVFDDNLNFIHLCCHYYNSAVYFALDPDYKNEDPKELKLNRIFDIILLLDKIDTNLVKKLATEFDVENELTYVMTVIHELTGNSYGFDVRNTKDMNMNHYYDKKMQKRYWPISLETRLYDIETKIKSVECMEWGDDL